MHPDVCKGYESVFRITTIMGLAIPAFGTNLPAMLEIRTSGMNQCAGKSARIVALGQGYDPFVQQIVPVKGFDSA